MRKYWWLFLAFLILIPHSAQAQTGVVFSQVQVRLWPEYDQPSMLVWYDLTLGDEVQLPATLTLRIPASAGKPHAVAARQEDGALLDLPFDTLQAGDWLEISLVATTGAVRLEYYDPALSQANIARHYTYRWPGDYAVESFAIEVQQPLGAEGWQLTPSLGSGIQGDDGLVYHAAQIGAFPAGQTYQVTLDYSKITADLSSELLPVEPVSPIPTGPLAAGSLSSALPWVLGFLGVCLVIGAGLWYWRSGRKHEKAPAPRRRHAAGRSHSAEAIYCHQCGKRASSGDLFCRTCGTQLRK